MCQKLCHMLKIAQWLRLLVSHTLESIHSVHHPITFMLIL